MAQIEAAAGSLGTAYTTRRFSYERSELEKWLSR
jgi:hypothetical protein